MIDLGFRNLMIFFKDKTTVFLSFLAEMIIVALYVFFLRDNLIANFAYINNVELLMDIWMIAGLLAITSVTTTMGAYGIMVEDKINKINKDFYTSPIKKSNIIYGYIFSAVIVGLLMTLLTLIASQMYIYHTYKVNLTNNKMLSIFLLIIVITIANSSLVLFLISFLKSNNALAGCCTIIGTLIGFLTGIYLPMGNLPASVQIVVKHFPVSHGVFLFRQILLEKPVSNSFATDQLANARQFEEFMGITFKVKDIVAPAQLSFCILILTIFIFSVLSVWHISIKKQK